MQESQKPATIIITRTISSLKLLNDVYKKTSIDFDF